jgi:hypothetical protein
MTPDAQAPQSVTRTDRKVHEPRVSITVTRTAIVKSPRGNAALELTLKDGFVRVALLPKNGSRREDVRLADLREALEQLEKTP